MVVSWTKKFSTNYEEVTAVTFDETDNTKIMIAMRNESNKNTYFVYLSNTGTVLGEYELTLYYENSGS